MLQNNLKDQQPSDLLTEVPAYTLYKPASTVWAALIGGPLAVAYMQAVNYINTGKRQKAWRPWVAWICGMLPILILPIFFPLLDRIPGIVYSIIMGVVAHTTTNRLFADALLKHNEGGGNFYKSGNVAAVIFLGLISYLLIVICFFVATDYEGFMQLFAYASRPGEFHSAMAV
jgi:hypothetical protein